VETAVDWWGEAVEVLKEFEDLKLEDFHENPLN
jgi:hypothetical protein